MIYKIKPDDPRLRLLNEARQIKDKIDRDYYDWIDRCDVHNKQVRDWYSELIRIQGEIERLDKEERDDAP